MAVTTREQELQQLVADLRSALAGRFENLSKEFSELAALLGYRVAQSPLVSPTPRITVNTSFLEEIKGVPQPTPGEGVSQILVNLARFGLRERPYDFVQPVTAPNEINDTGNSYDAGAIYDAWILNPSVDTRIDFNKPPSTNTPYISAASRMQFAVRAQKVYYTAATAGQVGTMQIWLLKYLVG